MMETINWLIANYELLVVGLFALVGIVKRDVLKLAWDVDMDGDTDIDDVKAIIQNFSVPDLAKVGARAQALDAKYLDAFYDIGSMSDADARAFLCAITELAQVPAGDRDALLKAVVDGNIKDIDFILESTDVARLKALATIFKQLAMTSFLTGKDPTPEMKERLYQVMKIAVTGDTSELDDIKSILAA